MGGPLEGIRVFEVSQIFAAPYCGVHLADLGADVVKVESPAGDGMRLLGAVIPQEAKFFHALNRGKRGITLDLRQPRAQELVHRLIADFDVFLINARPGVPERLRIDYDTLRQFRPDLVYAEGTGFGKSGPNADRAATDMVMQAYSGLTASDHKVDEFGAPRPMSITASDAGMGLALAVGICAALFRRQLSGDGEFIEASLLNSALALQPFQTMHMPAHDAVSMKPMYDALKASRERGEGYQALLDIHEPPAQGGAYLPYYRGYAVKDGAIVLGALTPATAQQTREALGIDDDPTADPDFDANDTEWDAKAVAFLERLRARLLTRTMDEWMELLDARGAPAAKVNFPEDMAEDPQVQAMGYMVELEHPLTGPETLYGPITQMRNHPTGTMRPSPPLGAHTEEVLAEHGISAEEIAGLRADGAFG